MIYSIGSSGEYVRSIQQLVGASVDGVYGPETARRVAEYQRKLGISADGVWGPQTQQSSDTFFNWLSSQQQAVQNPATPAPAPAPQPTGPEKDALAQLRGWLKNFGLEAITDKAWKFMVDNGTDSAQLRMWVYEQPEFKARFPALEQLSKKQRAISPEEYIQKETQFKQIMQSAGMVSTFFDSPDDFTSLIANEISPDVFQQRIDDGYQRVANALPSVRTAFQNYFGVGGDSALAAFFIDPERATPAILKAAKAAEIGGAALEYGVNVNLDYATKLANMGVSYQQAIQGMQKVAQMRPLFDTGVGEANVPGTSVSGANVVAQVSPTIPSTNVSNVQTTQVPSTNPTETGIGQAGAEFIFGTNTEIQQGYERRIAQRVAAGRGERTQGVTTRTGLTSLS